MVTTSNFLFYPFRFFSNVSLKYFFLTIKNGLNAAQWHMTLKYIKKIKGAADKKGDFDGTYEQGFTLWKWDPMQY